MEFVGYLRVIAFGGFFVAAIIGNITIVQLLDERRGRRVSAFRLLFFPYGLDKEGFTERGKRLHSRLQVCLGWAVVFWLACLFTMFA